MRTDKLLAERLRTSPSTEPVPVDLDAVVPCVGNWTGENVRHLQHTSCPNPAQWAGLSNHRHAKTTLRCTTHRNDVDIAMREGAMFCLTRKKHIHVMHWRGL